MTHDPPHIGVPLGAAKMIFEHVVLRGKPGTYLALGFALSPIGLNQDST
jgi:hypothetical protein